MDKKRHHFNPEAYLNFFCNEEGQVCIYRKDDPTKVIFQSPKNFGFHKYYYSQPLPEGGKDNNSLEDLFSEFETKWTPIIKKMLKREDINNHFQDILEFMALQWSRVPANRDFFENMLAQTAKETIHLLHKAEKLPPLPKGFPHFMDSIEISVNPHKSIHAMVEMIRAISTEVFPRMGFCVFYNSTNMTFLTSDNPVAFFDPSIPEEMMQPYTLRVHGPASLLFPVTPNLLIYGHSNIFDQFLSSGLEYKELSDREQVKRVNRHICRFGYQNIYSYDLSHAALIKKYAEVSPVLRSHTIPDMNGKKIVFSYKFGKRTRKAKWRA